VTDSAAGPRPVPSLPFLPRALFEPRRPLIAILVGLLTALVPSLLLSALVQWLLPSASGPKFAFDGAIAIFALVVFAPVVETLIMGVVLLVLLRVMSPTAAVLASSAAWGVEHSLAARIWGHIVWWPIVIFSSLFVNWRTLTLAAAFAVPAAAQELLNLGPAMLLGSGLAG
jgi:hypothetical protein